MKSVLILDVSAFELSFDPESSEYQGGGICKPKLQVEWVRVGATRIAIRRSRNQSSLRYA
jgi:hypothetical protein